MGVFLLAIILLSRVVSSQTNPTKTEPVKQEPQVGKGGVPAGPSGIFTIYDGSTLRRAELTFSIAYSAYDRDPGILDTSKASLRSGAKQRLGQPFESALEIGNGRIEAIDCLPQERELIPSGLFKDFRFSKRTWQRPIGSDGGIVDIKAERLPDLAVAESNNTDGPRLNRAAVLVTGNGPGGFLVICSDGSSSNDARLVPGDMSEVNQVGTTYPATSSSLLDTETLVQEGRSLEARGSAEARRRAIAMHCRSSPPS